MGRKAGKTAAACQKIARAALQTPGQYWWIGPSTDQTETATRYLIQLLCPAAHWRPGKQVFNCPNGAQLWIKTAGAGEGLRGEGLQGVVLDETAFLPYEIWEKVVSPNLEATQGWALFATTPDGFNWFHNLYEATRGDEDWSLHECPSWASPLMSKERLLKRLTWMSQAAWDQEYGGKFTAPGKAIFPAQWFDNILVDKLPAGPWPMTRLAVDPSSGQDLKNRDWQALVFLAHDVPNDIYYADFRLAKVNLSEFYQSIVSLHQQYAPQLIVVEAAFQQIYLGPEMQAAFGTTPPPIFPYDQRWQGKKEQRINRLTALLKPGKLRILANPGGREAVRQMRNYTGEPSAQGRHDDGPDVLEMAWRSMYLPMQDWLDPRPEEPKKKDGWW